MYEVLRMGTAPPVIKSLLSPKRFVVSPPGEFLEESESLDELVDRALSLLRLTLSICPAELNDRTSGEWI